MHKFIVKNQKEQVVGGVVYAPLEVDSDGDFSTKEEIQKAMYKFMQRYFDNNTPRFNLNHKKGTEHSFAILESFIAPEGCTKGGVAIKKGSWYMACRITDPDVWAMVESKSLQGWSMEGRATT